MIVVGETNAVRSVPPIAALICRASRGRSATDSTEGDVVDRRRNRSCVTTMPGRCDRHPRGGVGERDLCCE